MRDIPPGAERWLVWCGFIKRLPTTIFYVSLTYCVCFAAVTVLLALAGAEPKGAWLRVCYLGLAAFVPAMYLAMAGWLSRSQAAPPRRGRRAS